MDKEDIVSALDALTQKAEIEAVDDFGTWILNNFKMSDDERRIILLKMEELGVDIANDQW